MQQGCTKGQKSGGAGSNAARRRCPAAPSDLPKSGGAAAPPAPPLGASLQPKQMEDNLSNCAKLLHRYLVTHSHNVFIIKPF